MLQDQYRAIMQYSIRKDMCFGFEKPPNHKASADWFCIKVGSIGCKSNETHYYSIYSVEHKISEDVIIASNVMLLEWRVKKVVVAVMKFVHMLLKVSYSFRSYF